MSRSTAPTRVLFAAAEAFPLVKTGGLGDVCHLGPEPAIIDCLEFDRELRLLDPADELALLRLECDRLGAPAIGPWFHDEHAAITGDRPPAELLAFYRGYRACRRARLAAWHLREPGVDEARWRGRAARYLELALD